MISFSLSWRVFPGLDDTWLNALLLFLYVSGVLAHRQPGPACRNRRLDGRTSSFPHWATAGLPCRTTGMSSSPMCWRAHACCKMFSSELVPLKCEDPDPCPGPAHRNEHSRHLGSRLCRGGVASEYAIHDRKQSPADWMAYSCSRCESCLLDKESRVKWGVEAYGPAPRD